ncbi:MAG TPA: protein rep [Pyrinomonadaceae bacterium]|nr:protein rep [Pyrinomonadaceae bacterium]
MNNDSRSAPVDQQANLFESASGRAHAAAVLAARLERVAKATGSQMVMEKAIKMRLCSDPENNWVEVANGNGQPFKRAGALYACRVPFCPNCSYTRSRDIRRKARSFIKSLNNGPSERPRLITLTGPIRQGATVNLVARVYLRAFELLRKRKWWKDHVTAGIRVFEFTVTHNREINGHLHVFAISRFMVKDELYSEWSECLKRAWEAYGPNPLTNTKNRRANVDVKLINEKTQDIGPEVVSLDVALNMVANYICKGNAWANVRDSHLTPVALEERWPRLYDTFGSSRNTRATNTCLDTKQLNDGVRTKQASQRPTSRRSIGGNRAAANNISPEERISQQAEKTRRFHLPQVRSHCRGSLLVNLCAEVLNEGETGPKASEDEFEWSIDDLFSGPNDE